jgi:hypothetical protein
MKSESDNNEKPQSKVDKNLMQALNMSVPLGADTDSANSKIIVSPSSITGTNDSDRDYREVRDNLKRVIVQSEDAIQGVLQVAQETQSARAYEVAAQLIQATLEANNKLMHLHKQLKDIKREDPIKAAGSVTTTNNNIFVGNTAELSKFLRARKDLETATKELPPGEDIIDAR